MYKPNMPFNVPARILPTIYEKVNGVNTKRPFYSVVVSVLNGTRIISVYKDGKLCTDSLWVRTKYKSPRSQSWTDGVSRAITGTYTASYSTEGITYDVRIFKNESASDPLCQIVASDGEVKDSAEQHNIFVSAKAYGGTEHTVDDRYMIEDTLQIETWYRPDITSIDRLMLLDDNSLWEILNTPEDIDRRHQYLVFKVRRLKGNA